ncbi:diguanylate cyclase [Cupriavidus sp. L7L]|uniref:diguanylate cyclase n=1 Tax=Cupriavidus sp. L7L TaxID=2546443 RepID=UPI001FB57F4C|nr:diguanylate cyclase [Cupriavidus sp. L7L]
MSMLMVDIDRFKRINDNWGHASGDRVLKKLADVMRATVRAIDVPGAHRRRGIRRAAAADGKTRLE